MEDPDQKTKELALTFFKQNHDIIQQKDFEKLTKIRVIFLNDAEKLADFDNLIKNKAGSFNFDWTFCQGLILSKIIDANFEALGFKVQLTKEGTFLKGTSIQSQNNPNEQIAEQKKIEARLIEINAYQEQEPLYDLFQIIQEPVSAESDSFNRWKLTGQENLLTNKKTGLDLNKILTIKKNHMLKIDN